VRLRRPGAEFTACGFHTAQKFIELSDKEVMDVLGAALGGMQDAQGRFEKAAERIACASTQSTDSVDLITDMVEMLAARNQYLSNARVIQTGDDMQKKLLNILA
jgi:flagellar basal body rod protein FlgF